MSIHNVLSGESLAAPRAHEGSALEVHCVGVTSESGHGGVLFTAVLTDY